LQLPKAWAFHAQFHALATTHLHHRREWVAQVAHAQQVARAQVAPQVPVAQVAHAQQAQAHLARAAQALAHAQASEPHAQVALQAEPQVALQALLAQAAAQQAVAVAVSAAEPPVLSARVAVVARARLASQSVQSAKSSKRVTAPRH
jgi:hypothetical protein